MRKTNQDKVNKWLANNPTADFTDAFRHFYPDGASRRTHNRMQKRFAQAQQWLEEQNVRRPLIGGVLSSPDKLRDRAQGKTFVFTSAQSNTLLHDKFFKGLLAYCEFKGAELHISRFTYNKQGLGAANSKVGKDKSTDDDTWFDPRIEPYISDTSLEVTPDLVWCGELNIIPTRVNPISGFQNYTRRASSILPHAKMFMESVATMKDDAAKMIYTTGAVTQRNYIQKAAGQKADFHHVFGAVVVEVDEDGTWWARQINADGTGAFYDLDLHVDPVQGITDGIRVQAVTHGDLHGNKLDDGIADAVFKEGGILDCLLPREQFFHDTIDFQPRNHHNIKDPHFLHEMYVKGTSKVDDEFKRMGHFLMNDAYRDWCNSFIVVSNHDQAVNGWLRNISGASDPMNVKDWHYWNYWVTAQVELGNTPHPFKDWLSRYTSDPRAEIKQPRFLLEDDSYRILGEIEAALHGHLGPSGARGTPRNIRSAGKVNSGHTHSAGIFEGVYTAGVYGKLDMGYNKGLSSWSHSMVVTYPNAKRTILTIKKGKAWR